MILIRSQGMFAMLYHIAAPTPSQLAQKQHEKSQRYLSDARSRGKEEGMRRREEIRSWLRDRQGGLATRSTEDAESPTASSNQGDITGFGNAVSVRNPRRPSGYEGER